MWAPRPPKRAVPGCRGRLPGGSRRRVWPWEAEALEGAGGDEPRRRRRPRAEPRGAAPGTGTRPALDPRGGAVLAVRPACRVGHAGVSTTRPAHPVEPRRPDQRSLTGARWVSRVPAAPTRRRAVAPASLPAEPDRQRGRAPCVVTIGPGARQRRLVRPLPGGAPPQRQSRPRRHVQALTDPRHGLPAGTARAPRPDPRQATHGFRRIDRCRK